MLQSSYTRHREGVLCHGLGFSVSHVRMLRNPNMMDLDPIHNALLNSAIGFTFGTDNIQIHQIQFERGHLRRWLDWRGIQSHVGRGGSFLPVRVHLRGRWLYRTATSHLDEVQRKRIGQYL